MAIKKWIFDLNIQEKVKIPKMVLVQGDTNGNVFQIHLKQTVNRIQAPLNIENSIVTLTFLKEDESVVVGNADIVDANNGIIEYTCKGNEHSYPGIVIATVEIYDFTKKIRISSMQFRFTVTEQLDNGDAVVSTSEYHVITELISQIKPIIDSEETRITNENKRIANEDTREQSESIRIENENVRQQAENQRISNDTIIQQHEKTRITSENSREYAEKQRVLAEQERNSNEQIRNDNAELYTLNENTRKNNEETRQQHESTRQAAETSRQLAEDERQANENVRKSNEQERNTSEQIRQGEEDIRQANESTRQTEENTRAQNETTRVSEENARITNETSRKSNEKDRILAETARANAETERVQNEINRINAELQRETNEENREKLKSALELLQQQLQELKEHFENGNFGDMFKNVYDKNKNGIVDDAERLQGKTLQEIQADFNAVKEVEVSSYDNIISVPDSAINGQVSVSMKGRTLKQELNYNPETLEEWSELSSTSVTIENKIITVPISTGNSIAILRTNFKPSTKYGFLLYKEDDIPTGLRINAGLDRPFDFAYLFSSSHSNQGWKKAILTTKDVFTNNELALYVPTAQENPAKFSNIRCFELPSGSEIENDFETMSADELAIKYPFVSGTKSTVSAMRLKSVSEDESEVSTAYVIAKDEEGKVAELRSVPSANDEVRVSGGKAELVKRIDDLILDGSLDWAVLISSEGVKKIRTSIPVNASLGSKNTRATYKETQLIFNTTQAIANLKPGEYFTLTTSGIRYFYIAIDDLDSGWVNPPTKQDMKNFFNANPITLTYQLAEPEIIPVYWSGLQAYEGGTLYFDPIILEVGFYDNGLKVSDINYPIKTVESIKLYKVNKGTGEETPLDASKCVISEDMLSFTHPDLSDGDLCDWEYEYEGQGTNANKTLIFPTNLKASVNSLLDAEQRNKQERKLLRQKINITHNDIEMHINNTNNPHNVTIKQIGAVSQQDLTTHKAEKATQDGYGHIRLKDIPNPEVATKAEAETGTNNTKFMTPLRTAQAIDSKVRVVDNNLLELNIAGEIKTYLLTYVAFIDNTNAPGPKYAIAGSWDAGFFGEVPASELITGDALASQIGLSAGTAQFSNEPWLKFAYQGKIQFVAKKPFRYDLSWNGINVANAVYGDRTVTIGGLTYKVRLMRGANKDPAGAYDGSICHGSEWNRLMLPIHENAPNSWAYPNNVDSPTEDWSVNYTDEDLLTHYNYGNGSYSWCQEVAETASFRVYRGGGGVSDSSSLPSDSYSFFGWRPVLELL